MAAEVVTHSLAMRSLNLGARGGGVGGEGSRKQSFYPACNSSVVVDARVRGHNSQGTGCPLFVRFISNQP